MGVQRPIRERGGRHVRTDDAEGGSLMSRRVPRTLRTLKLDYREIAALLPAPPFSQPPCSLPARLPPSPSSSSSSTTAFSLLASPLRPPQTSSSSTFPATSFPESFSPLVRIGCIATDGRTWWALLPVLPTLASSALGVFSLLPLSVQKSVRFERIFLVLLLFFFYFYLDQRFLSRFFLFFSR